ncbi:MAG: hypothetical protein QOA28_10855, partial [Nitrososphaeraceae archaeon]|nr:hypothetical protein [Nitrososphaeraceae archaeon]
MAIPFLIEAAIGPPSTVCSFCLTPQRSARVTSFQDRVLDLICLVLVGLKIDFYCHIVPLL